MDTRRKVFSGKVVDAPKGKPIVAIVSTEDPDHVGDVIMAGENDNGKGWLLDDFNSRGRVYWMHNPFLPNLAKAKAYVDSGRLMMQVAFDMKDDFAAELDRKYREGYLTEWSVGFRGVKWDEDNDHGGWTFYEQTLDEVSAVNQGMNPKTATISKAFNEYADWSAEFAAAMDAFDARIRGLEAAVMRDKSEREARRLRAMLDEIGRIRTPSRG